jgi:hypothetical protein
MAALQTLEASFIAAPVPTSRVKWDAEIVTGRLYGPTGAPLPGRVGVFTREGHYLGDYSSADKILANGELAAQVEGALSSMGLKWEREIAVLADGGECVITYTLPGVKIPTPDGKGVAFRLRVENSYNGRRKVAAAIAAFRLLCLNGMLGLTNTFSLSRRHSAQLDVVGLVQTLTPEIENGAAALGRTFDRMPQIALPGDAGRHIIRNLAGRGPIARRLARNIESTFNAGPKGIDADARGTLWGLYNAGTEVISAREREGIEASERQAVYWGAVFAELANPQKDSRATLESLTVPRSLVDAYGDESHLLN